MVDDDSVRRAEAIFNMLEVEVNPRALVGDPGAGQKQLT
jgi:ribose transport system ATP-binding protein